MIGIHDPSFTNKESGMHRVESSIQDYLGLLYMWPCFVYLVFQCANDILHFSSKVDVITSSKGKRTVRKFFQRDFVKGSHITISSADLKVLLK